MTEKTGVCRLGIEVVRSRPVREKKRAVVVTETASSTGSHGIQAAFSTSQGNTEHFQFIKGQRAETCWSFVFSNTVTLTFPGTVQELCLSQTLFKKKSQSNLCPG